MVVPIEGKAKIAGAGPIGSDSIEVAKGREEVFGVSAAHSFDAEIVDDQREQDGASAVAPKAVGVATGIVAVLSKMADKAFIGDQAGLWQAVHAFADLDKDKAVGHEGQEVVLGQDAVGDGPNGDARVFVPGPSAC